MQKAESPRKELEKEVVRIKYDMLDYNVGSEEYLNACKSVKELSESIMKLRKVDVNTLIPGGASVVMFVIYMIFSDTHIMDTRAIQFCKSLFNKR